MLLGVVGCVMRKIFQRLGEGATLLLVLLLVCQLKEGQQRQLVLPLPQAKVKKKKIKQEKVKRAKLEESAEGTEAGPETKKRKIARSQKQLVISEEPERVSSPTVGKEVGHPLIPRT